MTSRSTTPAPWSAGLAALGLIVACSNEAPPAPKPSATAQGSASPSAAAPKPATSASSGVATTSPKLAVQNLDASIRGLERQYEARPADTRTAGTLVDKLLQRSGSLGRFDDLTRAAKIGDELVAAAPKDPKAHLVRARALAARHLFADALKELEQAEALGMPKDKLETMRATVLGGQGHFEQALAIMLPRVKQWPNISSLGFVAHLLGRLGRRDEAEKRFREAEASYHDVSPFSLANLYFEWGLMRHEEDDTEGAIDRYRAALARLPMHAHATVHLSELTKPDEGIEVLERLVSEVEEPEALGTLSELLAKTDPERSKKLLARARERYDELLEQHPLAFADHAGWFFLGPGNDPKRAAVLAEKNLGNRRNDEAYELMLECAVATKATARGCEVAEEALKDRYARPSVRSAAEKAKQSCSS